MLEGVDIDPQDFYTIVFHFLLTVFTFMRKHSPKFSGRITPFDPFYVRGSHSLLAEGGQKHSTSLILGPLRCSARDAQATPKLKVCMHHYQRTASVQGTAAISTDAAVTPDLERKSDETEEVNIEEKEASNVKSGETEELDLGDNQSNALDSVMESVKKGTTLKLLIDLLLFSRPIGFSIPWSPPYNSTSTANSALETTKWMRRLLRKNIKLKWDAEEERKEGDVEGKRCKKESLRKRKATTWLKKKLSKKPKLRTETIDELRKTIFRGVTLKRMHKLRVIRRNLIDYRSSKLLIHLMESISSFTEKIITFRAFDTVWDILHVLDRQDLFTYIELLMHYYETFLQPA
ncbi:hypothetical protein Tco_1501654 [Tanacetum coccineum]